MVVGQDAGGGLAVFLRVHWRKGPCSWGVGVAAASGVAAAGLPVGESAGQGEAEGGRAADAGGLAGWAGVGKFGPTET